MKRDILLNGDFESFLKNQGLGEVKVGRLQSFFHNARLDQLLDMLFEEDLHFIKKNSVDWVKEPVYPVLHYNSKEGFIFVKSAEAYRLDQLQGEFYCLAEGELVLSVRQGSWLKMGAHLFRLAKAPFLFLLALFIFERAASFAIAYQFQQILRLFDAEKAPFAFSLILGWGLLRLITMGSGAIFGYVEFFTLSRLKRSSLPGVLIGLFKNKNSKKGEDIVGKSFLAIDSLGEVINMAIAFTLKLPIQILALISFMIYLAAHDYRLPLLATIFFGLSGLLKNISGKKQSSLREKDLEKSSAFTATMSSFMMNFGIVLSHGVQNWALRLWKKDLRENIEVKNHLLLYSQAFDLLNNLIVHSIFFLTFYLVSVQWNITKGDFALGGSLSLIVSFAFASLEDVTDTILKSWDLKALLKTIPEPFPKSHVQEISPQDETSLLEIKSASYNYDNLMVLNNVNLTIHEKKLVAFVGENGSGKSTVIQSLLGFLDPLSGEKKSFFLNGEMICITKFDRLFPGLLIDNLFIGSSYDVDEIHKIMKHVCMDEWLATQPLGLKTIIGEKGVGLSGGENFRLLLARALLLKPKVLILDEATASLDLETESKILLQLKKFDLSLETIIIVTHRQETLSLADKIYKFENQTVSEYEIP